MSAALDIRHLVVRFGGVAAVKDLTLSVKRGESFGIVGESGSGKSTVLRAVAGLNRDWTGEIEVFGEKQGVKRHKAFHRAVQMVFQDPYGSLHPRQTVDDCLAESIDIHRLDRGEARIARVLDDVGLGTGFRFRYPHQLSGGQRQRVAIARALILEPKILLLDEPTSALDVSIQAEILNLLKTLREARDLTLVLVSHNLAVVGHMCGRIAVMRHGAVVEETDAAALRMGAPREAYTRDLLLASKGFTRA